MLPSLLTVTSSCARYRTMQDRGEVWPSATTPAALLPDFGSLAEGLLSGRLVATDFGWRPVETLVPGDMVLTFDRGMRRLESVLAAPVGPDPRTGSMARALHVPKDAIGNRHAITLLPSQLVLLDCPYAEANFGDSFMLVAAAYLEGYKGIRRSRLAPGVQSYMLAFAREEIIHADGSALLSCHATTRRTQLTNPIAYPRLTSAQATDFRHWVQTQAVGADQMPRMAQVDGVFRAALQGQVGRNLLH